MKSTTKPKVEPVFPLTVVFADGERETVESVNDAECNLECGLTQRMRTS
jgi:hypothetical protein